MGDVYKECKKCVCMLDVKIPIFVNQPYETWPKNVLEILAKHMLKVAECKWSKRVWTLQEWLLPPKACYTAETTEEGLYLINSDAIVRCIRYKSSEYSTFDNSMKAAKISRFYATIYLILRLRRTIRSNMFMRGGDRLMHTVIHLMEGKRECKNLDYYYGIAGIFKVSLTDGLPFLEVEKEFLRHMKDRGGPIIRLESSDERPNVYKLWRFGKTGPT
jgi:hypothetical protein